MTLPCKHHGLLVFSESGHFSVDAPSPEYVIIVGSATPSGYRGWCRWFHRNVRLVASHVTQSAFEISATRVETLDEFEIHIHLTEGGEAVGLHEGIPEIEHEASGQMQEVPVALAQGEYEAHVIPFEEGEHHIHFHGTQRAIGFAWNWVK